MRCKADFCMLCVVILTILSAMDYNVHIIMIILQVFRNFRLNFFAYFLFLHRLIPSTMDYRYHNHPHRSQRGVVQELYFAPGGNLNSVTQKSHLWKQDILDSVLIVISRTNNSTARLIIMSPSNRSSKRDYYTKPRLFMLADIIILQHEPVICSDFQFAIILHTTNTRSERTGLLFPRASQKSKLVRFMGSWLHGFKVHTNCAVFTLLHSCYCILTHSSDS